MFNKMTIKFHYADLWMKTGRAYQILSELLSFANISIDFTALSRLLNQAQLLMNGASSAPYGLWRNTK
jgi:hypothetical protein